MFRILLVATAVLWPLSMPLAAYGQSTDDLMTLLYTKNFPWLVMMTGASIKPGDADWDVYFNRSKSVMLHELQLQKSRAVNPASIFRPVSGEDMLPNLLANDIFYEEPFYYEQHGPNQGDVVTLHHMSAESTKFIELVRRVVGVPGDTIALKAGRIWINGRQVERSKVDTAAVSGNDPADLIEYEETLPNGARYRILEKTDDGGQTNEFGPITLSENQYFVLGDNRDNSWDSRSHTFGLVYGLDIEGRPNLILMSRELEQIGRTVQP